MLKPLEYLYFVTCIVEVYAEATHNEVLRFFSKPLLMIWLVVFYMQTTAGKGNRFHGLLVASLAFAWVGDVALMFVPSWAGDTTIMGITKNPNYFLAGLAAFLFAHMLYAVAFANVTERTKPPVLRQKPWVAIPLLIYMAALLYLLVPAISGNELTKPFLAPVIIYSAAIATMVAFALNRYKRVNDKSFALVFGGALLFMFSDSCIAINKFMLPFTTSGIFIMTLYAAGQYLIAKGALAQFDKEDR